MAARSAAEAPDRRIEFSTGINWGDVLIEDDYIHGGCINLTARLEGMAEPDATA